MTGYELLTEEQRQEMDFLEERRTHSATMVFTDLDAVHLAEYHALEARLESEYRKGCEGTVRRAEMPVEPK